MRCREARRLLVTEETAAYGYGSLGRHLDLCECCREEASRLAKEANLLRRAFLCLPLRTDFREEVFRLIEIE